jgi:hypothetical protein
MPKARPSRVKLIDLMIRKVLLVVVILFLVVVGAGAFYIHRITSELAENSRAALQKLTPRIVSGQGLLSKRIFYDAKDTRQFWQILVGWPADQEGALVTAVSGDGAHFLDAEGHEKRMVRFSEGEFSPIELVRTNTAGDYGFLTRDQSWASDVVFFDRRGQKRWSYPRGLSQGVDDAAVLEDTGSFAVVVGFNGGGGVVLLDGEGKKLWERPDANVWHVETMALDHDGHKTILHSDVSGHLIVRDASGQQIASYSLGTYISEFAPTRWGNESRPTHVLVPSMLSSDGCCKPGFLVSDAAGKTVAQLDAPLGDLLNRAHGTPIEFAKGEVYYAALKSDRTRGRSILFLYDSHSRIAYQEVLGEVCSGLVPMPSAEQQRLLIGCFDKIWEYRLSGSGKN